MPFSASGLIAVVAAYTVGSIPFGFLTAKFVGRIDIRTLGSGNIGATNVGRVLGAKWGAIVLALDALKGALPVWLLPLLAVPSDPVHMRVLCGVTAILGHMFPCWLGFRGGKGVATSLGVIVVLAPNATLVAVIAFAVTFLLSRVVSLSSIIAAVAFAAAQMWEMWPKPFASANWSLAMFSLLVPVLIIARHRSNLVRIWRGEETKFRTQTALRDAPSESGPEPKECHTAGQDEHRANAK